MTAILRQQHFTQIHTPKAHPSSHTQKHYAAAMPLLHQRHLCFDGRWWMGDKDHLQLTRGRPTDLLAAVHVRGQTSLVSVLGAFQGSWCEDWTRSPVSAGLCGQML